MGREKYSDFVYGKIADMSDRSDIEHWQQQSDLAKFKEAWRLVVQAHQIQGKDVDELRFQRSIVSLQKW